jgi:triacylglycerol lipase
VFALNYGNRRLGRIGEFARELDVFVDHVLAYTGAGKVSLVGYSQGGMMPRYWIKYLGGKSKVDDLVGFAPSNYGTELGSDDMRVALGAPNPCPACDQQQAGSRFIRRLNEGDDTPRPGSFTVIATDDYEIIIPYTRCFLKGEERTENITLQDYNGAWWSPTRTSRTTRWRRGSPSTPSPTRGRRTRSGSSSEPSSRGAAPSRRAGRSRQAGRR